MVGRKRERLLSCGAVQEFLDGGQQFLGAPRSGEELLDPLLESPLAVRLGDTSRETDDGDPPPVLPLDAACRQTALVGVWADVEDDEVGPLPGACRGYLGIVCSGDDGAAARLEARSESADQLGLGFYHQDRRLAHHSSSILPKFASHGLPP